MVLLGDTTLCFEKLSGGEPVVNDLRPKGNLPSQSALFLGRGRELVEISRTLDHPPAIMVLSGPPGIGKTSLVLEAAHRNAWRFPGGVAYAAGPRPEDIRTATAAEMLTALAGALGLDQTDDLARYTTAQPTLLLLDNLESLPPGELARLGNFLRQLGRESAALSALRPSQKTLEDLPAARPMPLHRGLAVEEAARYAIFLARQRQIPLTQEQARLIARAVDGHPLLVEQLVAQARRRDLDDLLREISERHGDFAALVETVYAWSAFRLDEAGLAAWAALTLFPAGSAPEGLLRAAVGEAGLQNLRECALADFDAAGQVWRWHATVAEYALGHWPPSEVERRARLVKLLPAWTRWLERQQARGSVTLNRLEESRPNLDAVLDACTGASYEEVWSFLDKLDACLPEPERTLTLRELVARVMKAKLLVLPAGEEAGRARLLNNLSIALSALGRREDALSPSEESVAIRRKLAASNPQAFLPDLAMSLGSFGSILQAMELHEEAARAFAEGLHHLAPFYRDLPLAHSRVGKGLVQVYLQACQKAGLEPDAALLSQFS